MEHKINDSVEYQKKTAEKFAKRTALTEKSVQYIIYVGTGTRFLISKFLITKFLTHKVPNPDFPNHKIPKLQKS